MAGLVPAIHVLSHSISPEDVDARDKRGHDEFNGERKIFQKPHFGRRIAQKKKILKTLPVMLVEVPILGCELTLLGCSVRPRRNEHHSSAPVKMPRRERRRAATNSEWALALPSGRGDPYLSALLCAEFGDCAGPFGRVRSNTLSLAVAFSRQSVDARVRF